MSGAPSEATIWTRERRYFFTSRSHRMKTTVMRSSPPHAGDLPHLVCGCGALVPDRRTGEREERRFERIGAGLLLQLRGRTGGDDAPVVDHCDAIGHPVGFVHVVRREEYSHALRLIEVPHVGPHLIAALWIEAERRLVQKQHLRGVQQPTGDFQAALHATGERLYQVIAPVPQLEHAEQSLAPLPSGTTRYMVQDAMDIHVLPRREVAVETWILEHDAEAPPHLRLMRGGIEPVELERAARGPQQGREHLDGRGLPGAVPTEKRADLTGLDAGGDVVDRRDLPERLDDVLDANDRLIAHLRPRRRRFGGVDEVVVLPHRQTRGGFVVHDHDRVAVQLER